MARRSRCARRTANFLTILEFAMDTIESKGPALVSPGGLNSRARRSLQFDLSIGQYGSRNIHHDTRDSRARWSRLARRTRRGHENDNQ